MSGFTPAVAALIVQRDKGCCAWCGLPVHGRRGFDWSIHHRRPRGAGGTSLPWVNAAANGLLVHGHGTSGCHSEIESDRAAAYESGFLVGVNWRFRSDQVPVSHMVLGRVLLVDDGSFRAVESVEV